MIPVVRFAPSPTGNIHIGNARTALLNALFARRHGGRFVLRFDDTDLERSRQEYADAIEVDLAWLGIVPDEIIRQSQRADLYAEAAARLKAAGTLYPCYESADELDRRRKRQQARGLPPVYDRAGPRSDGCGSREAWRPMDASRTGASSSIASRSLGTIWCAGQAGSIAPRSPIPC